MRSALTIAAVLAALGAGVGTCLGGDDLQDFAAIERGRYLATAADCTSPHRRCLLPLLVRLRMLISMGVVDGASEVTAEEKDAKPAVPDHGGREADQMDPRVWLRSGAGWLSNMHDWMISKKRYYGLALPIYDCQECGTSR